jgi:isochorismate hydrolase
MGTNDRLLDRTEAALLVIDVQERINDVMADQRHLPRLAVLIDACLQLGVPVVATEQYPKGLGTTVPELAGRLPSDPLVKDTFSCARESATSEAVRETDRRQMIVTGIEAHVCVLQTVVDLLADDREIHVPHDAVNSRRPADRDWALKRMAAAGAVITSTESVLFELLERCGTDDFRSVAKMIKEIPV